MPEERSQELANQIDRLQRRVDSLQSEVHLTRLRDQAEDLSTTAGGLIETVKELRARGYPFEKALDGKAADLERQWRALRPRVLKEIDRQASDLERNLGRVENRLRRSTARTRRRKAPQAALEQAEAAVDTLEEKVRSAERSIEGMYDTFQTEVNELAGHLTSVDWMLDQVAEAKFQLLPTEAGIMAVKARWQREGEDEPEGILYLTDQRLLFEQKQDIATKKVLFFTTEKEKVQQLLLEAPVVQIENAEATKRGVLGHEDHIDITFGSGGPVAAAHFHLDGQDSNEWQGLIGRVKAGDFDQDRAVELDEEAVQKARAAPSKCPSCGALISQPVLRGMDSLKCEYCGYVIRL